MSVFFFVVFMPLGELALVAASVIEVSEFLQGLGSPHLRVLHKRTVIQ